MTRPMMIFFAHHFAFFVYSSLSLPNIIMTPAQTIARTPRRVTILTNHLTIVAMRDWNDPSHFSTLHSYFRVLTSPQAASQVHGFGGHIPSPAGVSCAPFAIQVHSAQGIFSVTCTVTTSAYTKEQNEKRMTRKVMMIFCIGVGFFRDYTFSEKMQPFPLLPLLALSEAFSIILTCL